jgi:hypothetical protein
MKFHQFCEQLVLYMQTFLVHDGNILLFEINISELPKNQGARLLVILEREKTIGGQRGHQLLEQRTTSPMAILGSLTY